MKRWQTAFLAAASVAVLAGVNGCYTMLSHPVVHSVDEVTGAEGDWEISHTERCTECHTGNVHGRRLGFRGHSSSAYGDWYDYDPFGGYGSYYDPWLWGSSYSSPYFYDSYHGYRSVPWWLYNLPDSDDSGDTGSGSVEAPEDKPTRRGDMGERRRDSFSPLPSVPRPASGGVERPAAGTAPAPSGGSEPEKDKPARRGGMR